MTLLCSPQRGKFKKPSVWSGFPKNLNVLPFLSTTPKHSSLKRIFSDKQTHFNVILKSHNASGLQERLRTWNYSSHQPGSASHAAEKEKWRRWKSLICLLCLKTAATREIIKSLSVCFHLPERNQVVQPPTHLPPPPGQPWAELKWKWVGSRTWQRWSERWSVGVVITAELKKNRIKP